MLRAEKKLNDKGDGWSLVSLVAAVPIKSAARLLFACVVSAVLIVMTANAIWPGWISALIVLAVILPVLYFTYHLPAQTHTSELPVTTLRDASEMFRVAFDYSTIGMALVFHTGRWHRVNRSLCEILGYSEAELLAKEFQDFVHSDDRFASMTKLEQLLRSKVATYQHEMRCVHKDGHVVWVLWSVSQALVEESESVHLIFQLQSITDRKEAEERLLHEAFHDTLTGLPNRALMIDHLKLTIARTKRRRQPNLNLFNCKSSVPIAAI